MIISLQWNSYACSVQTNQEQVNICKCSTTVHSSVVTNEGLLLSYIGVYWLSLVRNQSSRAFAIQLDQSDCNTRRTVTTARIVWIAASEFSCCQCNMSMSLRSFQSRRYLTRCKELCRNQAGLVACTVPGCRARFRTRRRHLQAAQEVFDHMTREHADSEL